MSKRFPVPEFDRDHFKNLAWTPPALMSHSEQQRLQEAAGRGEPSAFGCYPIAADPSFYAQFKQQGQHLHAIMCLLPDTEIRMIGRSWAWPIQRALVVDSLNPSKATVLAEWTTPRPMNTRLGPDGGITLGGGLVYLLCGHRYGDHWIANRTLVTSDGTEGRKGFTVLSATEDDADDFHACNVAFRWS